MTSILYSMRESRGTSSTTYHRSVPSRRVNVGVAARPYTQWRRRTASASPRYTNVDVPSSINGNDAAVDEAVDRGGIGDGVAS